MVSTVTDNLLKTIITMNEYKFPFGTYKSNMDRFLEQFEDGKDFLVRFEPNDCLCYASKDSFYRQLNERMPLWFLKSCITFKKINNVCEPQFDNVRQAAWDAALNTYLDDKTEWCSKHNCD